MPDQQFIELITNSPTMSAVLSSFGMENKGNNYQTCKRRIQELKLDTSHFLNRVESTIFHKSLSKEEFILRLTENCPYKRDHIKKFLIKFDLLEYKCAQCSNIGEWNNKKLSLQLEHKNGISDDNRLENLEFLCPNCHSQTDTFAGKSLKKYYFCKTCGNPSKGYSKTEECVKCASRRKRKYSRPSKEELENAVKQLPMTEVAKKFGTTSDNTIRKWCKYYEIDWVKISPFSILNRKIKPKHIGRKFISKYLYVSYEKTRNKWSVSIKSIKFFKRFETELDAAEAVAAALHSKDLILRTTNL